MDGYTPDWSVLGMPHKAPTPDSVMPPPMAQPPRDPLIASLLSQVGQDVAGGGGPSNSDKLYGYAMLSALLGSAGASLGQAFRPWVKPPQALPSPQAPQMPITAPAALQALTQTRQARRGF